MALAGKYELVNSEGHLEHMLALGVPEDRAKKSMDAKSLEISINGDNVTIDRGDGSPLQKLVLGKETEEKLRERIVKNKAAINGNVLTIESDGRKMDYSLVGSELTVVSKHSRPDVPVGKRVYKKL